MNPEEIPPPRKVLIVRLGSLGDIIHAVPAQQRIARHFPGVEIHWLTEPPYAELLENVEGIERVWRADTKAWRRRPARSLELLKLARGLRRQNFDLALDFQGLLKSGLLAWISGSKQIIGFRDEPFKEKAAARFYTHTHTSDPARRQHVIEINLELAGLTGCRTNGVGPGVPLQIPSPSQEYVDARLEEHAVENPVLINPGAGWVTKRWPVGDCVRLARRIARELELPVVFTYGPGEEALIEEARQVAAPGELITFPTSIVQLAALCRRSRLMVAGDTGPLHLAVALGTPTVAIMGPTSPWRNGPFASQDEVVRRELPCSNSYKRVCDNFICMDIPVEDVFQAVRRRLRIP